MAYRILLALALACLAVPGLAQEFAVRRRAQARQADRRRPTAHRPPLAYVDDKGELVGFEIDLAHELAKDLLGDPNKVEFVVLQSDGRFPSALSGKIDLGLCSTTITGDRAVRIAFTRPYIDTGNSVIVRKDAGIKTIKELNDSKFTYAILNVPPRSSAPSRCCRMSSNCFWTAPRHCSSRSRRVARRRSISTSRSRISMNMRTTI